MSFLTTKRGGCMEEHNELVVCGCINPIACNECKGTGCVRIKKDEVDDSFSLQGTYPGIVNLSRTKRKGAYL